MVTQVGAPPEIACLLEEIRRENDVCKRDVVVSTCVEADPELDEFMVPSLFLPFLLLLSHTCTRTHVLYIITYFHIHTHTLTQAK